MDFSKKEVTIASAVPINNGDAALVFSLENSLLENDFITNISTYHYDLVKSFYPEKKLIKEITDYYFFRKVPQLKPIAVKLFFPFKKEYKNSVAMISAPGGYINSYYGFYHILELLKKAKQAGKATGIYSQSIGPLNKNDSKLLLNYSQHIDHIFVRDDFSDQQLKAINYPIEKYTLVEDGAFLIKPDFTNSINNKIAVSVRGWKHDNRNKSAYYKLIVSLVESAVNNGFDIDFISTCQGIEDYVNDSIIAKEIYLKLPKNIKSNCSIDDNYYNYSSFLNKLGDYKIVIGTRLHMCILALLKGIPAFNISYEIKGKECYKYLKIPELSIDYNEQNENALKKFNVFLNNIDIYKNKIKSTVEKQHENANQHFNLFLQKLKLIDY
ncbi:MAG: polysaccharide pyruvyl transferase family protein [Bacteroidales bacterium]|nr:polysaccharide pyruvyl transferase family protein [Bacteroidales bacterium]